MPRKLFCFADSAQFEGKVSGERAPFRAKRFPNGEWRIDLAESPRGCECVVVGSIAPPDERLLLTLLLAHTLKDEGATRVEILCPYLSYSRQDRPQAGRSSITRWLGALFGASGIQKITTVDLHSAGAGKEIGCEVVSLSPAGILAEALSGFDSNATLVAPDHGAIERCEKVRDALKRRDPITSLIKKRTDDGVSCELSGTVAKTAIVIDDILDTGGTLCAGAHALRQAGASEIYIAVSHGLFTGERWQELWQLGVKKIFCLNTVLEKIPSDPRIVILDAAPLFSGI